MEENISNFLQFPRVAYDKRHFPSNDRCNIAVIHGGKENNKNKPAEFESIVFCRRRQKNSFESPAFVPRK